MAEQWKVNVVKTPGGFDVTIRMSIDGQFHQTTLHNVSPAEVEARVENELAVMMAGGKASPGVKPVRFQ